MKLILKLLINAALVVLLSKLLSGVYVDSYGTAVIVAIVIALLNLSVKPLLVILTLPVTLLTLGLFLLIINGIVIWMAHKLVDGFEISSFWMGILFSILLTVLQSIVYSILKEDKKEA